jgi:ArsR family transcriptional regulator, arsenate/arsenite/antimonite-responsive transcriptional repressor
MESNDAIAAFSALAQGTRMTVFRLLLKREPEGIAAGELARLADVPPNTMSSHLAVLARAGLIRGERRSRSIVYHANLAGFQEVALFLLQDCCNGRADVCAPLMAALNPPCAPKEMADVR